MFCSSFFQQIPTNPSLLPQQNVSERVSFVKPSRILRSCWENPGLPSIQDCLVSAFIEITFLPRKKNACTKEEILFFLSFKGMARTRRCVATPDKLSVYFSSVNILSPLLLLSLRAFPFFQLKYVFVYYKPCYYNPILSSTEFPTK